MFRTAKSCALLFVVCCVLTTAIPSDAHAQVVTTLVPATPVVGFVQERRGLFGRRTVMRPVVAYPAVPVTTVPVAPVTVARPVVVSQPVTAWHPVAVAPPVTVARPVVVSTPVTVARPVVVSKTVTIARPVIVSQPVTTFYAPAPAPAASCWTPVR